MKKIFKFDYGWEASATFRVDTEKFSEGIAKETLDFFLWDYDKDNDPIEEALRKYAMAVIEIATFFEHSVAGVIKTFETKEGFYPIDGFMGIELIDVEGFEFNEYDLEMEVK